ncbi:hypothetical protein [Micromonospora rosaria]|uniref:hypothetical protein n=1 Tax=Micromonospora rosaria TaxID=47874 RepID=UPI0012F723DC|nr:hypothetical protein [Micromonospora rosaria]
MENLEVADSPTCGICEKAFDDRHGADSHDRGEDVGKRVEYVVVGRRGGLAEVREKDSDSVVRRTDASMLAFNLQVEESTLLGRRYSCWVVPAEYGVIRSDFRLITE